MASAVNTPPPQVASSFLKPINADLVKVGIDSALDQAMTPEDEKKEIDRLRSVHPLYALYRKEWDIYLAAYEGGPLVVNENYLYRHPREHEDDWRERLRRAHYNNYCERLVDFFTNFIYMETIDRDGGSEDKDWFNSFITDVNKKGENLETFVKDVCDDMQIFGMAYVMVDTPRKDPTVPMSKLQEIQQGVRPYWILIRPLEVLDWAVDDFEAYQYLKRQQFVDMFQNGGKRNIERYTEWTPEEVRVTDVDVTDTSKPKVIKYPVIRNQFKEIPIEIVRFKRSKNTWFMGNSFLRDLSKNNITVLNLSSLEDEFLYKQCFNVLAMERDTNVPIYDQQDGEWGISNVVFYPKDGKAPQYIAPDSKPAQEIRATMQYTVAEMYKCAAQDMVNELFNGHKSSGYSKSMSFSTTVPHIASRAETMEALEVRLFRRTYKYRSRDWKGRVKYKDRYEITNITDALVQLTTLFKDLQMPSETFIKAELKRMVHEFDGKLSQENLQQIEREIDSLDFKEFTDTQKLAYIGRAAMSPEAALSFQDGPVPGKETPPKASTPTRASSSTAEIQAESTKAPKPGGRKAKQ